MWSSSDGIFGSYFMKEHGALSRQMSAEQSRCTITSGHLGPINTTPALVFFSPLLSLHHCLLSYGCFSSLLFLSVYSIVSYFYIPPLFLISSCKDVLVPNSFLYCSHAQHYFYHDIYFQASLPVPPSSSAHTYSIWLFSLLPVGGYHTHPHPTCHLFIVLLSLVTLLDFFL